MIAIELKPDPIQIGWYTPDDLQHNSIESLRFRIAMRPHSWRPPTDVYETEEAIIVRVEIAGMRESDFSITLDERSLQIHGFRPDNPERRAYYQMEILFGEFHVDVELPSDVEAKEVEAVYRDGFLRILLPKVAPHTIRVENVDQPGEPGNPGS